jgi:hypothetical protein
LQQSLLEWQSFVQLIQDLVGGAVRRHTFTQCELDLLLDLQLSPLRKGSRADLLRRYLKFVQQDHFREGVAPPRLAEFAASGEKKAAAGAI